MALSTSIYIIFIFLIEVGLSTEDEIRGADITINEYGEGNNSTDLYNSLIYNTTDIDTIRPINIIVNDRHQKKCEVFNSTASEDVEYIQSNSLGSVYLNNVHSSLTSNLIEETLSGDRMEIEGVNLFDIVKSDCGGATVCLNVSGNWTNDKTITVGFLGAYGRSQVSFSILIFHIS